MTKQIKSLFLSDSDRTIFDTFKAGPSGYGVNEAYNQALIDIFGEKASKVFLKLGLKNRAPVEVICLIFSKLESEDKTSLMENAKLFFDKDDRYELEGLVPEGKGASLVWDGVDPLSVYTELLVRVKLSYLMKNIGAKNADGTIWPEMYPGVRNFIHALNGHSDFGIISSGHDIFIQKAFELYDMKCPDNMITDDDIRTNKYGPRTLLVKPNPQLILLAHKQWEYARDLSSDIVTYTGDDMEKDGKMAENAGIPFIHFDEENTKHTHWHRLHSDLLCGKPPFQNFG